MSIVQCKACSGIYPTKQVDGTLYFHVCPSSVSGPNARNENPPSTAASDAKNIIAAGLGTQPAGVIPPSMVGLPP